MALLRQQQQQSPRQRNRVEWDSERGSAGEAESPSAKSRSEYGEKSAAKRCLAVLIPLEYFIHFLHVSSKYM